MCRITGASAVKSSFALPPLIPQATSSSPLSQHIASSMFGLIRRISHSVIPRPDRPWADDPTSNAPQKGRKRRLSSTERDHDIDMDESLKKKHRGESSAASELGEVAPEASSSQVESTAVKEVTEGVKEVELADATDAAAVPLPEEEAGELDEPASAATPPLEAQSDDDNASSVNEEPSPTLVDGTTDHASPENSEDVKEAAEVEDQEGTATAPAVTEPDTKKIATTDTTKDNSSTTTTITD
ncbi:hypothetical protein D9615_003328 [Tricholomella constricta]|uniref:Uncharacterized protein n=1 Tax=Tricholomella constricta TaxID=117010 RepID=A0A8H5HJK5_9AGAR|nr:hypothetical protein D9615_003328 [Tricholomella constricta]